MSKIVYRKIPALATEKEFQPQVPVVNHSSRKGWKNDAAQAYEDAFGVPITDAPNDLAIPFPSNTFSERFKLGLKTSLLTTMFSMLSFFKKERGTHQHGGIGATGTIRFLQNELTNKLKFCQSATELPFTLRHSNASFEDDGCGQLRAMAFRIHQPDNSVEDFLLGTGAITPFWNLTSLLTFAKHRGKVKDHNWDPQKIWMKNSPTAFIAAIEAGRLAPESYTKMSYYSAIPYGIEGTDEFIKFRVMPANMDKESGMLSSEQQRAAWIQNRVDNNDKPVKYLADEYRNQVSKKPVIYTLEVQVRKLNPSVDSAEFFNLTRYWDDIKYPWQPIAELSSDKIVEDSVTEKLAFWLGNIPRGLDFVEAYSADDYNSIATGRIKIYPKPQRLRRKKEK